MTKLKNGWQKIMPSANARQKMQQNNFAHNAGPQSSDPKTKGFHENFNRPVGGGRNGE